MATSIIIGFAAALFIAGVIYYNSTLTLDQEHEDIDEEEHWYARIIYINPQDERPFVPKHAGGGFTVNFANALGVITTIGFLLLIGWVIYTSS